MGRLERIIVVGALVTVGALVAMLVWRGLERREAVEAAPPVTEWGEAGSVPLQMTGELPLPAGVLEESAAQDAEAGEGEILEAVAIEPALDGLPVEGAEPAAARTPEPRSRVAPSPPTTYKVRRGDTLSGIAKRELGSAQRWRDIQRLNPDLDPARLRPGQILVLPPRDASPGGGEGKALAAEAAARGGEGAAQDDARLYTVRPGDSLWKLAYRFYGGPDGVERILAANQDVLDGKDAVLRIGMTLRIPR